VPVPATERHFAGLPVATIVRVLLNAAGLLDLMNHFLPFRGWRYDLSQVGDIADVLSPLAGQIDEPGRDALYRRHPCNIVRVLVNRDEPGDTESDARSRRALEFVRLWQHEGILVRDREDSMYVIETQFHFEGLPLSRWAVIGRMASHPDFQPARRPPAGSGDLPADGLTPELLLCPDESRELPGLLERTVGGVASVTASPGEGIVHRLWAVSGRDASRISQLVSALLNGCSEDTREDPSGFVMVVARSDESLLVTQSGAPPEFLPESAHMPPQSLSMCSVWPPLPVGLVMDLEEWGS
jgi:hypothetical protein